MSVLTVTPKFLYPISRQFPFDEVAEKIVRALEKRNWKVPGITVEFYTYGSGEAKYKMVDIIKGENFKLNFCRNQGKLSKKHTNIAALSDICIPEQIIEVYSDESGPSYYLYVGKNWNQDKEWFMNSTKINSKLNKEPRRYLRYVGDTYNTRAKELIFDTDLGREYSPIGDEPQSFNLSKKFEEFTNWLEKFVLNYILTFPEEEVKEESIVQLIPYQGPWTTVYGLCYDIDKKRILKGKKNIEELHLEDRHAYFGSGHRLVHLCCKGNYPKIANEGFIWCDVNSNININSNLDEIASYIRHSIFSDNYIVAIKPKYANGMYVADNAVYEETRKKLFESIAPRNRLTDKELDQALAARGATIIPITEYKGDYKQPILLIERELDFDEIEWIADNKQ